MRLSPAFISFGILLGGVNSEAFDRASAPGRMAALYDRIVSECLLESRPYTPVFLSLDSMNQTSATMTALMVSTGLQEGYVDRHASPRYASGATREILEELRSRVVAYSDRRGLDPFQRACVAQCVGYQWFRDTPENGESRGNIETGDGNCRHSTYLASYFDEALGVKASVVDNGIKQMAEGIGHTYSLVELEGRRFAMNNNLGSDSQANFCSFRFSRAWESHRECSGFSGANVKHFRGYAKAWNRDALPETGAPVPFTGSARSCGDQVTFENQRSSGVLSRPALSEGGASPFAPSGASPRNSSESPR